MLVDRLNNASLNYYKALDLLMAHDRREKEDEES